MKTHVKLTAFFMIILMGLSFTNCQKSDVEPDLTSDHQININAVPVNSQSEYDDLMNLISKIESLETNGIISPDAANALISKVKNAIKSIQKGNSQAVSGLLKAFVNEVNSYITGGILTMDQGQLLTEVVEYVSASLNGSPAVNDGLIAYYPFSGNAKDGSGNGRDGIAASIIYGSDRNGKPESAAYFNGEGCLIQIPGLGPELRSFSISFWYRTTQGGTILSTDNIYVGADDSYNQLITSWVLKIGDSDGVYAAAGNPVYFDNTWHHVVMTHNAVSETIITYFDGNVRHERPSSGYFVGNSSPISIGSLINETNTGDFYIEHSFTGGVDDIYFFNRALTAEEVAKLNYYPASGNISLANTTWDFTVNFNEDNIWHADVTFYEDGTALYDEPDFPGYYTQHGTWTVEDNVLHYVMDSSGGMGDSYVFTGIISGNTMSGTFTWADMIKPWSAVLKF
jgi:hypothetical protein